MSRIQNIIAQMNERGKRQEAFVFVIDFEPENALLFAPEDQTELLWQANDIRNFKPSKAKSRKIDWHPNPVSFYQYKKGFNLVQHHIHNGDTYLLNYTQPTAIKTNLTLEEIFHQSEARYKILLKDKFVCFSPEKFVQINGTKISSYPMKGTMDATLPNAKHRILNDSKELAEHNTIVDLIRNDLSLVADNVCVEKFRYLERLKTNHHDLWQVSSKINGDLPKNYAENIGNIIVKMLPAGSICGAPKKKDR